MIPVDYVHNTIDNIGVVVHDGVNAQGARGPTGDTEMTAQSDYNGYYGSLADDEPQGSRSDYNGECGCPMCETPELRDVRVEGRLHLAAYAPHTTPTTALCGQSLDRPAGPATVDFCEECQRRQGCDECGHGIGTIDSHVWAPLAAEHSAEAGQFVFDNATCWAENICRECDPLRYAQVLGMLEATHA